ncbi:uncharacterized protein LOC118167527 isoform X2 [Oxyura jamaicensis]|uniref:uncharacterized protein LOC118167527 isoform X2 n=3 Tax=Oxyura jamaicensis TaxID=8884 RepID=UPI0015A7089E|nr:uncharacterized protein LOC118167527 isoform X2 [Oxyura jamaicensis]
MALVEKRRRRRHRAGQPMEGLGRDAQEMKLSVKSSDYIERLAHKYMKCIIESSTESESESSTEVMPSPLAEGLKKARDSKESQFLDPYDGDSEDASIHSDCSSNSLNSIQVAPWVNSAPKAMALEDADPSEDGESFPETLHWLRPETKIGELYTQIATDCKAPLELATQQKDFSRSLSQSSELTRATEAFPSMWLTPDCSLLTGINSSASADLLASPGDSVSHTMLTNASDETMSTQPLIKRKQGIPTAEGAGEKLRRKKFRAI